MSQIEINFKEVINENIPKVFIEKIGGKKNKTAQTLRLPNETILLPNNSFLINEIPILINENTLQINI